MQDKTSPGRAWRMALGLCICGVIAVAVFVAYSLGSGSRQKSSDKATEATSALATEESLEIVRLEVDGMTCGGCATNVASELEKIDGVEGCTVDLEGHTAEVRLKRSDVSTEKLIAAVETAGFSARLAP